MYTWPDRRVVHNVNNNQDSSGCQPPLTHLSTSCLAPPWHITPADLAPPWHITPVTAHPRRWFIKPGPLAIPPWHNISQLATPWRIKLVIWPRLDALRSTIVSYLAPPWHIKPATSPRLDTSRQLSGPALTHHVSYRPPPPLIHQAWPLAIPPWHNISQLTTPWRIKPVIWSRLDALR